MADAEQTLGGRYALPRDAAMTGHFAVELTMEAMCRQIFGPEFIWKFIRLSPFCGVQPQSSFLHESTLHNVTKSGRWKVAYNCEKHFGK